MDRQEAANSFSLSIANLGVLVHYSPSIPGAALWERYRDFPLHDKVHLCLEITLSGEERSSPLLDTGMSFQHGRLYFTAAGYEGFLSEQEGKGRLRLSSRYAVQEVDYCLRVAFALLAYQAGGIMLHAAGIQREGQAYLFFGHSGAGKTTVSSLSTRGSVLNDDLVMLLPDGDGWRVFGTPFWNPSQVKPTAQSGPLAAVYHLEQSKETFIAPMDAREALAELVANTPILPADPNRSLDLLQRLSRLIGTSPVSRLHFQRNGSFWDAILSQRR